MQRLASQTAVSTSRPAAPSGIPSVVCNSRAAATNQAQYSLEASRRGLIAALAACISLKPSGTQRIAAARLLECWHGHERLVVEHVELVQLRQTFSFAVAGANVLQEYVERSQRPELTPEQAVVILLDARGVLFELKSLAATAPNSDERFRARALLPGMAKRLRQVGQAAPVLIAQATGNDKRSTISKEYGGRGDEKAVAVPIYQAIGQVITISGRTIKKEAQASPALAENAITRINELLKMLPSSEIEQAQQLRRSRQKLGLEIKHTDIPSNAIAMQ